MKIRLAALAASGFLFACAFAAPAAADPGKGPAGPAVDFCDAFPNGPPPSFGGCVSYYRADDVAAFCKQLKDFDALFIFGWESQGECVRALTKD